jgi:hypothetical protein
MGFVAAASADELTDLLVDRHGMSTVQFGFGRVTWQALDWVLGRHEIGLRRF